MLLYDNPITSASQDEFGRKGAALRCARMLTSIRSNSSFVVGLSGQWGSGKTSFVNMVKEALGSLEMAPIIVDFNAWLYSSQEQLVRQFFSELNRAMGGDVSEKLGAVSAKELGNVMTEYSDAISEAGSTLATVLAPQLLVAEAVVPFVKGAEKYAIRRVLQGVGSRLKGTDKTIEQLRSEIAMRLSKLDANVVVIIDDVDRLPREDVRALFKQVNLTASFPRMTFLLSYDETVVRKALSDIQGIDGLDYLEKIVQLPIELPKPSEDLLRAQLEQVIGPYFEIQPIDVRETERNRLLRMFDTLVMNKIETPRQVKRYLNKLDEVRSNVEDEVNVVDVIGMTSILLFYPTLASWLWANREYVCTTDRLWQVPDDPRKALARESLDAALASDATDVNSLMGALSVLFPKVSQLSSNAVTGSINVGRETGRVAHIANLELIFATADGLEVRRRELVGLATVATEDALAEGFVQLDEKDELKRLVETIEECRPNIGRDRKAVICKALLSVLGRLRQEGEYAYLMGTPTEKAALLTSTLLRDLGVSEADALVSEALEGYEVKDFIGFSWFLQEESASQSGEGLQPCLSSGCYSNAVKAYIGSIVSNYPSVLYLPDHPAKFLWRHLDESLAGDALQAIRERYGNSTATRILCSAAGLSHWSSGYADGYGYSSSLKESYDTVFKLPESSEVDVFGKSTRFRDLPDEVKVQVAALYLLQRDGKVDQLSGDRQVTRAKCIEVVAGWEDGNQSVPIQ